MLIERVTREWADTVESNSSDMGGIAVEVRVLDRPGPGLLTAIP